jgi:hypothetical protein
MIVRLATMPGSHSRSHRAERRRPRRRRSAHDHKVTAAHRWDRRCISCVEGLRRRSADLPSRRCRGLYWLDDQARSKSQETKAMSVLATKMMRFSVGGAAAAAFCGASALASDLPTKAPAGPATSCFASLYDYMDSSAQECPLTWNGITVYGAIDVGVDYMTHGAPFNGAYPQGVETLISKNSQGARYSIAPNGLGQSVAGIRGTEEITQDWSFVFRLETGFDPYSLQLANGPRSLRVCPERSCRIA